MYILFLVHPIFGDSYLWGYIPSYVVPYVSVSYFCTSYIWFLLSLALSLSHRNPPTYIHPPSVGMIYPISTYIFKWHLFPKLLASYIQYKYIYYSSKLKLDWMIYHLIHICPVSPQTGWTIVFGNQQENWWVAVHREIHNWQEKKYEE